MDPITIGVTVGTAVVSQLAKKLMEREEVVAILAQAAGAARRLCVMLLEKPVQTH